MFNWLLILILITAAPWGFAAEDNESKRPVAAPADHSKDDSPLARQSGWKVLSFSFTGGTPLATLAEATTGRTLALSFEPDVKGNQLLSATFAGDSKDLQVVAMIDKTRCSISQKLKEASSRRPDGQRGPSEEDRRKYEALSEPAKAKFRELLREKFSDAKFRESPEEERRAAIRSIYEKVEKEAQSER